MDLRVRRLKRPQPALNEREQEPAARLRRAQAAFERVLEIDPTDDHARFGLGRTLERQSRQEEALAQYKVAVALHTRL